VGLKIAISRPPPTPIAAASVTLASPLYIEPITSEIRKSTGSNSPRARSRSPQE
jgi:hypothetical protein